MKVLYCLKMREHVLKAATGCWWFRVQGLGCRGQGLGFARVKHAQKSQGRSQERRTLTPLPTPLVRPTARCRQLLGKGGRSGGARVRGRAGGRHRGARTAARSRRDRSCRHSSCLAARTPAQRALTARQPHASTSFGERARGLPLAARAVGGHPLDAFELRPVQPLALHVCVLAARLHPRHRPLTSRFSRPSPRF
jgi:hypothetical protein